MSSFELAFICNPLHDQTNVIAIVLLRPLSSHFTVWIYQITILEQNERIFPVTSLRKISSSIWDTIEIYFIQYKIGKKFVPENIRREKKCHSHFRNVINKHCPLGCKWGNQTYLLLNQYSVVLSWSTGNCSGMEITATFVFNQRSYGEQKQSRPSHFLLNVLGVDTAHFCDSFSSC